MLPIVRCGNSDEDLLGYFTIFFVMEEVGIFLENIIPDDYYYHW